MEKRREGKKEVRFLVVVRMGRGMRGLEGKFVLRVFICINKKGGRVWKGSSLS